MISDLLVLKMKTIFGGKTFIGKFQSAFGMKNFKFCEESKDSGNKYVYNVFRLVKNVLSLLKQYCLMKSFSFKLTILSSNISNL